MRKRVSPAPCLLGRNSIDPYSGLRFSGIIKDYINTHGVIRKTDSDSNNKELINIHSESIPLHNIIEEDSQFMMLKKDSISDVQYNGNHLMDDVFIQRTEEENYISKEINDQNVNRCDELIQTFIEKENEKEIISDDHLISEGGDIINNNNMRRSLIELKSESSTIQMEHQTNNQISELNKKTSIHNFVIPSISGSDSDCEKNLNPQISYLNKIIEEEGDDNSERNVSINNNNNNNKETVNLISIVDSVVREINDLNLNSNIKSKSMLQITEGMNEIRKYFLREEERVEKNDILEKNVSMRLEEMEKVLGTQNIESNKCYEVWKISSQVEAKKIFLETADRSIIVRTAHRESSIPLSGIMRVEFGATSGAWTTWCKSMQFKNKNNINSCDEISSNTIMNESRSEVCKNNCVSLISMSGKGIHFATDSIEDTDGLICHLLASVTHLTDTQRLLIRDSFLLHKTLVRMGI